MIPEEPTDAQIAALVAACPSAAPKPRPCDGNAWVITRYKDGTLVEAHPNHRPDDIMLAVELGYGGDVQAMTVWHDPIHTRLAHALGLRHSPVLWALAHGRKLEPRVIALEEDMVLATQRFLNAWQESGQP